MTSSAAVFLVRLWAIALALLLSAGALQAQGEAVAPPPAARTAPQNLLDVIGGEKARSEILESVRTDAAEGLKGPPVPDAMTEASARGSPQAAVDAAGAPEERDDPVGARLIDFVLETGSGFFSQFGEDFRAARTNLRRLTALSAIDREAFLRLLPELLVMVLAATAVAVLLRLLLRPFFRRVGVYASSKGPITRLLLGIFGAVVDFLAMCLGVPAALIAVGLYGASDDMERVRAAFLGAYFVAALLIVAMRAFLSPASPHMRIFHFGDDRARYWTRHSIAIICLLTFGTVMVSTMVSELGSPIAAKASVVAINVLTILYVAVLAIANRKAPAAYCEWRAAEDEESILFPLLAAIAPFWLWVALPYLAFLFHQAVTLGGEGIPLLLATSQIAAAFTVGVLVLDGVRGVAERGVRLPERLHRQLPELQPRINAFAPPFLKLTRWIVFLLWLGFALQVVGVVALWDWVELRLGVDVFGAVTSLVLIAMAGFAAWLVVNGWIDYRLASHRGHVPTARERTLLALLRNASLVAIILLGLIYSLSEIGVSVAPLLASAGVVGLAIGFGSQKLVQDIITGVFIQFENAINVGDVIEAGGKIGTVEKLTIRSVSLRDVEGVFHVIPFSSVDLVSNHMMGYSHHLADISIAYGEDIDAAKDAILAAYEDLQADPLWSTKLLGGIEWFGVQALADSAVILRARLKTRPGEQWAVGRAYSELVKKRLDAAGIEIPFPQLTLWFGRGRDGRAAPAHVLSVSEQGGKGGRRPRKSRPVAGAERVAPGQPTDSDFTEGDGDNT